MSMLDKIRAMTGLGRAGAFNPGAQLMAPKQGTGKRLSPKEREKLRKEREKEERRRRREQRNQGRDDDGRVARAAALISTRSRGKQSFADREGMIDRVGSRAVAASGCPIETRGRRGLGTGLVLEVCSRVGSPLDSPCVRADGP